MGKAFNRLYVHVPFCAAKCAYCAFYSEPGATGRSVSRYLDKLEDDFRRQAPAAAALRSVFIGGGTPTWLSAAALARLFQLVRRYFSFDRDCEVSVECNPETLSAEKADILAAHANRVSFGAQSFQRRFRDLLGRRGSPDKIHQAFALAGERGMGNLSIDLIYGVPGQTPADWGRELELAAALPISHLSAYSLTYEEGSRLAAGPRPDEAASAELEVEMWEMIPVALARLGIARYEVSNYARPGRECRHNLEIWLGDTYLGCGPAATSFDGSKRWTQPADLEAWLSGAAPEGDQLPPEKLAAEIFAMGLRSTAGWSDASLRERTGVGLEFFAAKTAPLVEQGLLASVPGRLYPTKTGLLFWDDIAMEIL